MGPLAEDIGQVCGVTLRLAGDGSVSMLTQAIIVRVQLLVGFWMEGLTFS